MRNRVLRYYIGRVFYIFFFLSGMIWTVREGWPQKTNVKHDGLYCTKYVYLNIEAREAKETQHRSIGYQPCNFKTIVNGLTSSTISHSSHTYRTTKMGSESRSPARTERAEFPLTNRISSSPRTSPQLIFLH
jgi:hypothetical protein